MTKKIDDKTLLSLCLTGWTQTKIAEQYGITKCQISRRINSDAFQEMLSEYRKRILDGIMTELTANAQKSVQTLVKLLDSENEYIQMQSACKILSFTQDYSLQHDILRDIEAWKEERRFEQDL